MAIAVNDKMGSICRHGISTEYDQAESAGSALSPGRACKTRDKFRVGRAGRGGSRWEDKEDKEDRLDKGGKVPEVCAGGLEPRLTDTTQHSGRESPRICLSALGPARTPHLE